MGFHVRRASRIVTQIYDTALRPVGLVQTQFSLLIGIQLLQPVAITELAAALFTDQTTITRNIRLLEQRGLVSFHRGEDLRRKLASLTPEGTRLLEQALPLWREAQEKVRRQIGERRWEQLLTLLSELQTLR